MAVRVGFIGCGRVSENHYRAVKKCENAQLVAVGDIDVNLANLRAQEWGVVALPCEEICSEDTIDAVFVLTPPSTHCSYAMRALARGKHVLVEKPVSFSLSEIKALRRMAEETGKVCMPGHSYIYLPELERGMRLVREGNIGEPVVMYMSEIYFMPPDLTRRYLGPTNEVLWHHIYLMLAYLGLPERVQAFCGCFRHNDVPTGDEQVMVSAAYSNGTLAHLFISWATEDETSDPWTFKVKVLGTKGGFHFSRRDVVTGGGSSRDYPLYQEMFEREVNYFINECVLRGEQPLSSLRDAELTLYVLTAVKASLESGTAQFVKAEGVDLGEV